MTNVSIPREVVEQALDLVDEIVLAGMSGSGQESEEGMRDFHAQQAWRFISIAARAKEKLRAALATSTSPAPAVPADKVICNLLNAIGFYEIAHMTQFDQKQRAAKELIRAQGEAMDFLNTHFPDHPKDATPTVPDAAKPETIVFNNPSYEPWLSKQAEPGAVVEWWQPIETAPKDGTWLLLYAETYREFDVCAGFWGGVESNESGWYNSESASYKLEENGFAPTHWIPLPAAPKPKDQP